MVSNEERFWGKVIKTDTCWLWTGCVVRRYGRFRVGLTNIPAHRFSYELAYGNIPEGFEIDHQCRVAICVNPRHLRAMTKQENLARRIPANSDCCPNGHDYNAETVGIRSNGSKYCKICSKSRVRAFRQRLKEV